MCSHYLLTVELETGSMLYFIRQLDLNCCSAHSCADSVLAMMIDEGVYIQNVLFVGQGIT